MFDFLDWMPVQASNFAPEVDWINNFISIVSFISIFLITTAMLYFAFRYRKRVGEKKKTLYLTHSATLETLWTVVPTIACIYCFYIGFVSYDDMRNPPANTIDINVKARKWAWDFEYENGKTTGAELVVPVGKPVRLIMKSADVNHSFFIPAMRIKEDVIASHYSYLWFTPTKLGEYPMFCAEYCGTAHSNMRATLKVVESEVYNDFLNSRVEGGKELSPVEQGAALYKAKGCVACHSIDGSKVVGPSFKGLFGKTGRGADGKEYLANEDYIRTSILKPNEVVTEGFPPGVMYSFEGQITEDEITKVIAYLKTLKSEG